MIKVTSRNELRKIRHSRIRKTLIGTAEKPRLVIFISLKNIYAQIIDDERGITLVSASSLEKEIKDKTGDLKMIEIAKLIGSSIGKKALEKGITQVVFDRSGYKFHGRVKAFADEARSAGLKF